MLFFCHMARIWVESTSSLRNFSSRYSNVTFTGRPSGRKHHKKMSIYSGYIFEQIIIIQRFLWGGYIPLLIFQTCPNITPLPLKVFGKNFEITLEALIYQIHIPPAVGEKISYIFLYSKSVNENSIP